MNRYQLLDWNDPGRESVIDADLDLSVFYPENDLEPEDCNAIADLGVGAEHLIGGGAAGLFAVRRVG